MRYCADVVNVNGQGGSVVMRGDKERLRTMVQDPS